MRIIEKLLLACCTLALCTAALIALPAGAYADTSGSLTDRSEWSFSSKTGTLTISGYAEMTSFTPQSPAPWYSFREDVKRIVVSMGINGISSYAFYGCCNATVVSIGGTVGGISEGAFEGCTSLPSVSIPAVTSAVGERAFRGCTSLKSVKVTSMLARIGSRAFEGCTALESFTCSDIMKTVPAYAFAGCSSLKEFTFPSNATEIGGHAFDGCSSLESVTVPASVASIGADAFQSLAPGSTVWVSNEYAYALLSGDKSSYFTTANTMLKLQLSDEMVSVDQTACTVTPGESCEPAVSVKIGTTVISPANYTVVYSNNTAAGTGTATVTGTGDLAGTATASFEITEAEEPAVEPEPTPSASDDDDVTPPVVQGLKLTSPKAGKVKVTWTKAANVSGYVIYYKVTGSKAKTVYVAGTAKTSKLLSGLSKGKKAKVKIAAYISSDGKKTIGTWSAVRSIKIAK